MPERIAATPDEALRGCGFSASKVAAIRDICAKALDGTVPSAAQARRLTDDELIARLSTIRGVGRWTVEMLLISTLGRPDVLPVDDFGVREGWRLLTKADGPVAAQATGGDRRGLGALSLHRRLVSLARLRRRQEGQADAAVGRNPASVAMNASGASACSQCPAPRRVTNRACGNSARNSGRCSGWT